MKKLYRILFLLFIPSILFGQWQRGKFTQQSVMPTRVNLVNAPDTLWIENVLLKKKIDSLTATLPIAISLHMSSQPYVWGISIADAAADGSTKGAATFNATNFTASSGIVNTIQNINTGASPTFVNETLTALTNGYLAYKTSSGWANSGFYWDGTRGGIGTTNPSAKLSIGLGDATNNGYNIVYTGDGTQVAKFIANTGTGQVTIGGTATNYFPTFYSNGSEAMRISIPGGNVGIGYSTGTEITNNKLAVNGSGFFNGTLTLPNSNVLTGEASDVYFSKGIKINDSYFITPQTYSTSDPYTGFCIGQLGSTFGKLSANEMHVKTFVADQEQALLGSQIICKSVAKLAANCTPTYDQQPDIAVEMIDGYSGHVFADGDIVRFRSFTRGNNSLDVVDSWALVFYDSTSTVIPLNVQYYNLGQPGVLHGSTTTTYAKGSLVLDYGTTGNGILERVAISAVGNKPYDRIATWTTAPYTDLITLNQIGDLSGLTTTIPGYSTLAAGTFGMYTRSLFAELNVNIAGNLWALTGGIGGTSAASPVITLANYGMKINNAGTAHSLGASEIAIGNITGVANSAIKLTNTGTNATTGLFGYDASAGELFALRLDGTASVGGLQIFPNYIQSSNFVSGSGAIITGNNSTFYNSLGDWTGTNVYWSSQILTIVYPSGGVGSLAITIPTTGIYTLTISAPTTYYAQFSSAKIGTTAFTGSWSSDNGIWTGTINQTTTGSKTLYIYTVGSSPFQMSRITLEKYGTGFKFASDGTLIANQLSVQSSQNISSGNVAGFVVNSNGLSSGKTSISDATAGIWVGIDGISIGSNNPFSVNSSGYLTATNATISGSITVTGGNAATQSYVTGLGYQTASNVTTIIGNTVTTGYVNALNITANSVVANVSLSSPSITGGTISIGSANNIFKSDANGIYLGNASFASAPFSVSMAGALIANNATINTSSGTKHIDVGVSTANEISFFENSTKAVSIGSNINSSSLPGIGILNGMLAVIDINKAFYTTEFHVTNDGTNGFTAGEAVRFYSDGANNGHNYAIYSSASASTGTDFGSVAANYSFYGAAGILYNHGAVRFDNLGTGGGLPTLRYDAQGRIVFDVSSLRYKENITDMDINSSLLYDLRPVSYNYKTESKQNRKIGFIAEEIEKIFPSLIGYDKEGKPNSVVYDMLVVPIIAEMKKQKIIIDELQEKYNRLSNELKNIKK